MKDAHPPGGPPERCNRDSTRGYNSSREKTLMRLISGVSAANTCCRNSSNISGRNSNPTPKTPRHCSGSFALGAAGLQIQQQQHRQQQHQQGQEQQQRQGALLPKRRQQQRGAPSSTAAAATAAAAAAAASGGCCA